MKHEQNKDEIPVEEGYMEIPLDISGEGPDLINIEFSRVLDYIAQMPEEAQEEMLLLILETRAQLRQDSSKPEEQE